MTSLKSYIILNIVPLRLIGTVCPSHTRAGPGTPTVRKRLLNENIKRELFWCKRRSWILFIPCSFWLKVLSSFLWSYKGINLVENLGMSAEWFWKIALSARWALAENGRWTPNYIIEPTRLDTKEIWHKKVFLRIRGYFRCNRISFVQGVNKQYRSAPLVRDALAESGISFRLSCVDAVIRWQLYINKAFVWVVRLGHILAMPQIAPVDCWHLLTWWHP